MIKSLANVVCNRSDSAGYDGVLEPLVAQSQLETDLFMSAMPEDRVAIAVNKMYHLLNTLY